MNHKEFLLHPTICSLPWIGVYIEPNGDVKNCGVSATKLGNLHSDTLEHCVTGAVNQQIKNDMIMKVAHPRCNACYKVENLAHNRSINESNRSWYKKFGLVSDMNIYDSSSHFDLSVLDLRWRNTCNQACVYCGPDLSSKWAQELNDWRWVIDDQVIEQNKHWIFNQLHKIKHVYLAGGEPLVMKENQELLTKLYQVNPDVEIRINTNLSTLDTPVYRLLQQFHDVKWTVSVDAVEDSYEYIRWPGNWHKFCENLKVLQSHSQNINFNMVWCALNAFDIFDCIDFLNSIGCHENMYIIQCLSKPSELDVRNLPADQIHNLKQAIQQRQHCADPSLWLAKCLNSMYNFLHTEFVPNLDQTQKFLHTLDQRRRLDSQKVFAHVYHENHTQ